MIQSRTCKYTRTEYIPLGMEFYGSVSFGAILCVWRIVDSSDARDSFPCVHQQLLMWAVRNACAASKRCVCCMCEAISHISLIKPIASFRTYITFALVYLALPHTCTYRIVIVGNCNDSSARVHYSVSIRVNLESL